MKKPTPNEKTLNWIEESKDPALAYTCWFLTTGYGKIKMNETINTYRSQKNAERKKQK